MNLTPKELRALKKENPDLMRAYLAAKENHRKWLKQRAEIKRNFCETMARYMELPAERSAISGAMAWAALMPIVCQYYLSITPHSKWPKAMRKEGGAA